jgi:glutaredoxin 3
MAAELLEERGIEYEKRELDGVSWTVSQLREQVPDARTVPQIFIDDEYVGGYDDLEARFRN